MTRYVIAPDVALVLAEQQAQIPSHHRLLAPTLFRSPVLAELFGEVKQGTLQRKQADQRLNYLRGLQIRFLGDRVLQQVAWKCAEELDWRDTLFAEYLALTKLQADALVILDHELRRVARRVIPVATLENLLS